MLRKISFALVTAIALAAQHLPRRLRLPTASVAGTAEAAGATAASATATGTASDAAGATGTRMRADRPL